MTDFWSLKWSSGPPPERSIPRKSEATATPSKEITTKKRDRMNEMLCDRELMPSTGTNPFRNSNNYGEDIDVQSKFLIPGSNSQFS